MAYQAPSTRKPVVAEHWVPSEPDLQTEDQLKSLSGMKPLNQTQASPTQKPDLAGILGQRPPLAPTPPFQDRDIDTDLAGLKGYEGDYGRNAEKIAGLQTRANDPTQQPKASLGRKILAGAAGVGATMFTGNPLAGYGAYRRIADDPKNQFKKGLADEASVLAGRNEALKEQAGMNEKGLDFISQRMGQKVQQRGQEVTERGQDVTLAGQESASANAMLGASKETIEVPLGNGKKQIKQLNPQTQRYDINVGAPIDDNELAVPVTPELLEKFPSLQGVPSISQSTWEKLANPAASGSEVNNQNDYYDLKGGGTTMADYNPRTKRYTRVENGVDVDITEKIKGPHREPSAGLQILTMTDPSRIKDDDIRDAFLRTSQNMTAGRRYQFIQTVEDQLRRGDTNAAKTSIKQAVIDMEPAAVQQQVNGRRELMAQSAAIKKVMQEVPTGLIAGTLEKTIEKLGQTGDPKYASLITRMKTLQQTYRKAMTGAQFSLPEAQEYASVLPSETNNVELNLARMDGLAGAIETADKTFWASKFSRPGWGDFENVGFSGAGPSASQGSTGLAGATNQALIKMYTPDGKEWNVHPSREQEAIKRGATRTKPAPRK